MDRFKFRRIEKCDKCCKTSYWEIDVSKLNAEWVRYYSTAHTGCNCCLTNGTASTKVIEQSTGQRDKYDTLIFDGDKVKAGRLRREYTVVWQSGSFVLSDGSNCTIALSAYDDIKITGTIHDKE